MPKSTRMTHGGPHRFKLALLRRQKHTLQMAQESSQECARTPEQLTTFLLNRMNAGDVDGVVALYEAEAVLVLPDGKIARGTNQIRDFYANLLANHPQFEAGEQSAPLINGDIAITSSTLQNGTVTVEIARLQPVGSWLWSIDNPAIGKAINNYND
jgi:ketosteroid isomerase-like protein